MPDSRPSSRTDGVDELVKSARSSREAFGQLFDHFYPAVFAYCSRRLLLRAVAEDVTSETFLKVARSMHAFSGTCAEDFRRWLFRIATNEINAQLRKSIRRRELLEAAAQMGTIPATISNSLRAGEARVEWEEICQALHELSEREQNIISLRYFAGLKHDEIAAVLKLRPGAIRVALSRTLDKLRERLRSPDVPRRAARQSGR